MHVDGRCHCGAISYSAEVDPAGVYVCHCTDCQVFSGSAFRTGAGCRYEDFNLLTGKLRIYVKVAESGRRRAQAFCPDCGTPIYSTDSDTPGAPLSLRLSAVAQRSQLVPGLQLWCRSKVSWIDRMSAVEEVDKEEGFL